MDAEEIGTGTDPEQVMDPEVIQLVQEVLAHRPTEAGDALRTRGSRGQIGTAKELALQLEQRIHCLLPSRSDPDKDDLSVRIRVVERRIGDRQTALAI